jgi:hypothetical protein
MQNADHVGRSPPRWSARRWCAPDIDSGSSQYGWIRRRPRTPGGCRHSGVRSTTISLRPLSPIHRRGSARSPMPKPVAGRLGATSPSSWRSRRRAAATGMSSIISSSRPRLERSRRGIRPRIVAGAERYLSAADTSIDDWLGHRPMTIPFSAIAGLRAILLLKQVSPEVTTGSSKDVAEMGSRHRGTSAARDRGRQIARHQEYPR